MLDHPGLVNAAGTDEVAATAGDPDPPTAPAPDTRLTTEAELDIPPF